MTPDLLPRAFFMANLLGWDLLCCCLVRLAAPRIAAAHPWLGRLASLAPLWQKGDCLGAASYRLIFVKSQMGLLQEGVLMQELRPTIQAAVSDNQSWPIVSLFRDGTNLRHVSSCSCECLSRYCRVPVQNRFRVAPNPFVPVIKR